MDDLRERIAYLQGLAEGLKLEEGKDEAKILKQIIDLLADLVDEVEELRVAQEDLEDYLECLDEELEEAEDEFEDDFEEESFQNEENGNALNCEEDIDYVEMECPKCHDIICFEADLVDDEDVVEVTCPNCNEVVFVNDGSMPLPPGLEKRREQKTAPFSEDENEDI
ncbi:MAG: AraC family transcriptional regulator [Bacillota bacterium]|nr:AraC family transcriptional regulator [Bacillota bacterium]